MRNAPRQPIQPILKLVTPACHDAGDAPAAAPAPAGQLTVALIGQPNVGKSTVFNMLTGLSQHVGNWPGKTVEQKTGTYRYDGTTLSLVDLPGTYSLTANSEEERLARDYLIRERPDVVIAVVNAAALERNLYLVAELLAMQQPLVLGLNMLDVAEQHGIHVEPHVLEAALGVPVAPIVATKNQGLKELTEAATRLALHPDAYRPNRPAIRPEHEPVLCEVRGLIADHTPAPYPQDWVALKLLEGDAEITALMRAALPVEDREHLDALLLKHEDAYLDIAGGRYEWIGRMMRAAVTQPKAGAITRTARIDRVATHPIAGLALLLGLLGVAFWLTYTIATPIADWLSTQVLGALDALATLALGWAPSWLSALITDGLIPGVGTVFAFLPILIIFFAILGTLEDVGYLARGAYVMDRFMHLMGLHGKSFMPLFLGFGCNVPAVLGSRIIEERRARWLTILLAPLVPCTARLAVLAFLIPAFFVTGATLISFGLVALNLAVLAVAGIVVNKLAFRGDQTAFIMELPLYHVPNGRTVGLYVWNNTVSFVKKAGTLILLASMVVWALSSFPGPGIDNSVLAAIGRSLEPIGQLMGLNDWRIIVALLTSFFAKENTIATLGILFNTNAESVTLAQEVALVLVPAARVAFLAVVMLFIPCLATVATIKQETNSWRWPAAAIGLTLALSLGAGIVIYQVAQLIG
ncbi:MAG: ferrous iron transport protein B [Anaerolineae bacterium]|nr:ferrous iron transport protein B [Anaerolineae bacterium]